MCLLGLELSPIEKGNVAYLFSSGIDFLKRNRVDYQTIVISCCIIQLEKLHWNFSRVVTEPELMFLKKNIENTLCQKSGKTLYIIHREENPILLEPIKRRSYILII